MEFGTIELWTQRSRGEAELRGPYLLTLSVGVDHGRKGDAYPQARAVMDDFGTLVLVSGWL